MHTHGCARVCSNLQYLGVCPAAFWLTHHCMGGLLTCSCVVCRPCRQRLQHMQHKIYTLQWQRLYVVGFPCSFSTSSTRQQAFNALCLLEGHIHIAQPKNVCDSSKGGYTKALRCTICDPPDRPGALDEAEAALSILRHVCGAQVAMQYKLPCTDKAWDMLVLTHHGNTLVEVDGRAHFDEMPHDRVITARTGKSKAERDTYWEAHAAAHGLPVLRVSESEARACGVRVSAILQAACMSTAAYL